jgi:hypothetical protein
MIINTKPLPHFPKTHHSNVLTFHHSMWGHKDGAVKNFMISINCRNSETFKLWGVTYAYGNDPKREDNDGISKSTGG